LERLLAGLQNQVSENCFSFSIVVVDNDYNKSAKEIVAVFKKRSLIDIDYYTEPVQNIALARNRAVENAKGNFIGFIDDDEFPIEKWLLNLYKALKHYGSDGVLGPVLPFFEKEPPRWVLQGRFFERATHPTGHVLGWRDSRTGNVLLRRELFKDGHEWFDASFGSGGEDRDFFKRMIVKGFRFLWCAEAPVYETVTAERCKRSFMLRRALLRGQLPHFTGVDYAKSLVAVPLYTASLPFLLAAGHHLFMKYLIKNFDHIGRLLTFIGINVIKEKYI